MKIRRGLPSRKLQGCVGFPISSNSSVHDFGTELMYIQLEGYEISKKFSSRFNSVIFSFFKEIKENQGYAVSSTKK